MAKNKISKITFWISIVGILVLHIFMVFNGLPQEQVTAHAWINIIASILVITSYIMRK